MSAVDTERTHLKNKCPRVNKMNCYMLCLSSFSLLYCLNKLLSALTGVFGKIPIDTSTANRHKQDQWTRASIRCCLILSGLATRLEDRLAEWQAEMRERETATTVMLESAHIDRAQGEIKTVELQGVKLYQMTSSIGSIIRPQLLPYRYKCGQSHILDGLPLILDYSEASTLIYLWRKGQNRLSNTVGGERWLCRCE